MPLLFLRHRCCRRCYYYPPLELQLALLPIGAIAPVFTIGYPGQHRGSTGGSGQLSLPFASNLDGSLGHAEPHGRVRFGTFILSPKKDAVLYFCT
jgi:hypothetical protein